MKKKIYVYENLSHQNLVRPRSEQLEVKYITIGNVSRSGFIRDRPAPCDERPVGNSNWIGLRSDPDVPSRIFWIFKRENKIDTGNTNLYVLSFF